MFARQRDETAPNAEDCPRWGLCQISLGPGNSTGNLSVDETGSVHDNVNRDENLLSTIVFFFIFHPEIPRILIDNRYTYKSDTFRSVLSENDEPQRPTFTAALHLLDVLNLFPPAEFPLIRSS